MSGGPFLFFVVESKSDNKSDWMYIESVILHHYKERGHHRHAIYMGGKSNLMDLKKIASKTKKAIDMGGEIHIIICADKDVNDTIQNNKIIKFCKDNGFDLVWMNQNIEDVFLDDANVDSHQKGKKAADFRRKMDKRMEEIGIARLMVEQPLKKSRSSNLMLVLDKYIERKER